MSLRLAPYPAYKDSGVPWLPSVPDHWPLMKTKYLFRERVEKDHPDAPLLAATQTRGVVRKDQFEHRTVLAMKDLHLLKLVKVGDFVISLRSFQGGIERATHEGIISPAYTVLEPTQTVVPGFFAALLKCRPYVSNLALFVTGIRQGQNIEYEKLARSSLPLPCTKEQEEIARFLDQADRRINRLVRAKRRLIELLNEQRQAIIHHAVTRGLDPNVRLKPSGIDWLGDVPEEWEVVPFTKSAIERADYRGATPEKVDSGVFLVTARNVKKGWIDYESSKEYVREDQYDRIMRRGKPRKGDVLLTMEAPLGNIALIDRDEIALAQRVVRFRMNERLFAPEFVLLSMLSPYFQDQLLVRSTGSTAHGIKASKLPQLLLLRPPLEEQHEILRNIETATGDCAGLVVRATREIDLLREYRTRLIADVVTGKLDVRGVELPPLDDDEPLDEVDAGDDADADALDDAEESGDGDA